jgi:hypothetical protein
MDAAGFIAAVKTNPVNRSILERLPALGLPDAWLVSGSLFQTVWNALTRRPLVHGIKDYDIFYFDPDRSWEAEDGVIRRCADTFGNLGVEVEVRNQARVHLWYRDRFGVDYPALASSTDSIDRFLAPACMVGLRPTAAEWQVYAPRGFDDIEAMIVRPNPCENFQPERYEEKAARWKILLAGADRARRVGWAKRRGAARADVFRPRVGTARVRAPLPALPRFYSAICIGDGK